MFNDILTGKASSPDDKQPVAADPYRPDPGPTDLECASCRTLFPATQAVAGRCRACAPPVDAALAAMKGPKADYTDHGGEARKRDFGLAILMVAVFAAVVVTVLYVKHQLRKQSFADSQDELGERIREQSRDLQLRARALRATSQPE